MGARVAGGCLALFAACGFKAGPGIGSDASRDAPSIDSSIDGSSIDSAIDAMIDVPSQSQCSSSGTMDTFQGNTPCSPWATFDSTNGATTTQMGGKLRVAEPAASTGSSHGGCFATGLTAWGSEGVFINVEQALVGVTSYTALTAYVAAGTAATIVVENGTMIVRSPGGMTVGSRTYVPAQMQWWRLRPVANGVVGETSPDALIWTAVGTVVGVAPTMIRIDISAGTSGVEAAAGTAVFDNLSVCP